MTDELHDLLELLSQLKILLYVLKILLKTRLWVVEFNFLH